MKPPHSIPSQQGILAKRTEPTLKPIVALSERKKELVLNLSNGATISWAKFCQKAFEPLPLQS